MMPANVHTSKYKLEICTQRITELNFSCDVTDGVHA